MIHSSGLRLTGQPYSVFVDSEWVESGFVLSLYRSHGSGLSNMVPSFGNVWTLLLASLSLSLPRSPP